MLPNQVIHRQRCGFSGCALQFPMPSMPILRETTCMREWILGSRWYHPKFSVGHTTGHVRVNSAALAFGSQVGVIVFLNWWKILSNQPSSIIYDWPLQAIWNILEHAPLVLQVQKEKLCNFKFRLYRHHHRLFLFLLLGGGCSCFHAKLQC